MKCFSEAANSNYSCTFKVSGEQEYKVTFFMKTGGQGSTFNTNKSILEKKGILL